MSKSKKPARRLSPEAQQAHPDLAPASLYLPEYAQAARIMCLLGATNEKLAEGFHVTESTVTTWMAQHADFAQAVREGREQADAFVATSLYHRARGYSHQAEKVFYDHRRGVAVTQSYVERFPPDTGACIFWLKNRQPAFWQDQRAWTGPGGTSGPPPPLEQRIRAARELRVFEEVEGDFVTDDGPGAAVGGNGPEPPPEQAGQ